MMLTFQQGRLILSTHFLQGSSNLHIWIIDKCARKLKYEHMHCFYFESINLLFILMEENIGLLKKRNKKAKKKQRTEEWEIAIKYSLCAYHIISNLLSQNCDTWNMTGDTF